MNNSAPRMVLACISILTLPVAAFGQEPAKGQLRAQRPESAGRADFPPNARPPRVQPALRLAPAGLTVTG